MASVYDMFDTRLAAYMCVLLLTLRCAAYTSLRQQYCQKHELVFFFQHFVLLFFGFFFRELCCISFITALVNDDIRNGLG